MRVHVLSDLHLEFGDFDFPDVDVDLVVLAGDTHTKLNGVKWAKAEITNTPVQLASLLIRGVMSTNRILALTHVS